jgi:hemin uptake protein HemP
MIANEIEPMPADTEKRSAAPTHNNQRVFDSRMLFGQEREIRITHNGASYSLRMTRLGKLLLTK